LKTARISTPLNGIVSQRFLQDQNMPSPEPETGSTAEQRWINWRPRWQRVGQEPDYRFTLANERTFLAWIRTALSVLAGAVLLVQFATRLHPEALLIGMSLGLAGLAAVLSGMAYARWKSNERAMRHGRPLPASLVVPVLAGATVMASTGLLFMLLP
jgi:putative membrane protein